MKGPRSRSTNSDNGQGAYLAALRLLAARDYSVSAMKRKLHGRGFHDEEVLQAVERLVSERFLDDRRYAERFAEGCLEAGRFVGYRLRHELRRRGISADMAEEVIGEADSPDQVELAAGLVARKYPGFNAATADDSERRRVAGFLQRKGFSSDAVIRIISRNGISTDI